jgi:hypothetical protein
MVSVLSLAGDSDVILHRFKPFWQPLLCICFIVGCGGSDAPKLVPVTGVVTFKKQPIGKINVLFVPADGAGMLAEGTSKADGTFQLQTKEPGDGAMEGNYKVSFKFVSDVIPDMPGFAGAVKPEPSPIPAKYADENRSGVTATVTGDVSKNDFQFNLE